MSKLDAVIERLRQLPPEEQDAMATEMEFMLEHGGEGLLTAEQWADLRQRMAEPQGEYIPHEEIVAEFQPCRRR